MFPDITPGSEGVGLTETANVCGMVVPQALMAATEIVPPELPTVATIEVVVELPDQPEGKVHE